MSDQETLAELLKDAVSAISNLVQEQGLEAKVPVSEYEVRWMEPRDDGSGSASGRSERRTEPNFSIIRLHHSELYSQLLSEPQVQTFITAATDFADNQGIPLAFYTPKGSDLAEHLLATYFNRVGSFKVDISIGNQVCSEYVTDLQDSTAIIRELYFVDNFSANSQFNLNDEIEFRKITLDDIESVARVRSIWPGTQGERPPNLENWVCEVQPTSPKDTMEIYNQTPQRLEQIVGALNIAVEGRATFTLMAKYLKSPFLSAGTMWNGTGVSTSGIGGKINMTPEEVESFKAVYQKTQQLETDSRLEYLELPFRRLRLAAERTTNEDRLVDYVIGLERLLTNRDEGQETAFRFRVRGASLLPESFGDAKSRITLMRNLYSLRSDVVHGKRNIFNQVNEYLPQAEKVLKTIFLWYLNHSDTLGNKDAIIRKLDESLVSGGSNWAYPSEPEEEK